MATVPFQCVSSHSDHLQDYFQNSPRVASLVSQQQPFNLNAILGPLGLLTSFWDVAGDQILATSSNLQCELWSVRHRSRCCRLLCMFEVQIHIQMQKLQFLIAPHSISLSIYSITHQIKLTGFHIPSEKHALLVGCLIFILVAKQIIRTDKTDIIQLLLI